MTDEDRSVLEDLPDTLRVYRGYRAAVKSVGLAHVRIHDLRHAHATELLRSNINLKIVQERLGHSPIAVTADTYSHVAPTLQREAADSFGNAMRRSRMTAP